MADRRRVVVTGMGVVAINRCRKKTDRNEQRFDIFWMTHEYGSDLLEEMNFLDQYYFFALSRNLIRLNSNLF